MPRDGDLEPRSVAPDQRSLRLIGKLLAAKPGERLVMLREAQR